MRQSHRSRWVRVERTATARTLPAIPAELADSRDDSTCALLQRACSQRPPLNAFQQV